MDSIAYMRLLWAYFPYMIYTYVLLSLLTKSIDNIIRHARADYEANRNKYHRCYSPDLCCHTLSDASLPKQKARKVVTRVYPKKQGTQENRATQDPSSNIKRQVQASAIQTQTNVNQIARMFETGGTKDAKKINRVTPTILPEIRMHAAVAADHDDETQTQTQMQMRKSTISQLSNLLLQENIENSQNLLNHISSQRGNTTSNNIDIDVNWQSEPLATSQRQRHGRPIPPNILTFAGTSATPSTASPAASTPLSSPLSSSPATSPVRLRAPLNMKSSLEDIFAAIAQNAEKNENFIYAGCNALSPVTSIDDILSERRLSRPLSAYSISDLLSEENIENNSKDDVFVENFLRTLNTT